MNHYEVIRRSVLDGSESELLEACRALLDEGADPLEIVQNGLVPVMDELGVQLSHGESFIPQVLISARVMQQAVNFLEPMLLETGRDVPVRDVAVIGTVQGDIHTIGKNLVGIMLRSSGYRVVDLGANVSAERFIRAVRENKARVVTMSALLTTSMVTMKRIVRALQEEDFGYPVKILVGGGPITPSFAREAGVEFGGSLTDTTQKVLTFSLSELYKG